METEQDPSNLRSEQSTSILVLCPKDILSCVSIYLSGKDICSLWECGSKILNMKLRSPRTILKFEHDSHINGSFLWPAMIGQLSGLTCLTLKGAFKTSFKEIHGFPRTLQKLHLEFYEAASCFDLPMDRTTFLQTIPKSAEDPLIPNSVDMSKLLPDLEFLHLEGSCAVTDYFVSSLPKALKSLSLFYDKRGKIVTFSPNSIKNFPPSLTSLSLSVQWMADPELMKLLPRSLVQLNLKDCMITDAHMEHLPPNLTYLAVYRNSISDKSIAILPKYLTTFDAYHCTKIEPAFFSSFPRELQSLSCWSFGQIRPDPLLMAGLPKLAHLKIHLTTSWTNDTFSYLPSTLESLHIFRGDNFDNGFAINLPRGLLSLTVFMCSSKLNGSCAAGLPRNLQRLVLSSPGPGTWKNEHISHLPRSLTDLELDYATSLTDVFTENLPRSLTRLAIRHIANFTYKSLDGLPSGIKEINAASAFRFDDKSAALFPRSLTVLVLGKCSGFTGTGFKNLPPDLDRLVLGGGNFDLDYVKELPKKIRHLSICDTKAETEYFATMGRKSNNATAVDTSKKIVSNHNASSSSSWLSYLNPLSYLSQSKAESQS